MKGIRMQVSINLPNGMKEVSEYIETRGVNVSKAADEAYLSQENFELRSESASVNIEAPKITESLFTLPDEGRESP